MTRSRDLANLADSTEFTSADHTKLDGIETAATADQTNAEIKTAVEAGADIALAGNPTTTTQSANNNSTRIATTGYTDAAIAALADSAPATLNTLNELAAALGDDANFSTTVTNSIATKLPLAGGAITGNVTFGDSNKAIFGTGSDFEIYHDGSNSYVDDTGTGRLYLRGNDRVQIQKYTGEDMITAIADGAVKLYHNNVKTFETTSLGAAIGSAATKVNFYSDGTYSGIYNGSSLTSDESIYMGGDSIIFYAGAGERLRITGSKVMIGTTLEGSVDADELTLSGSGRVGMTIRSTDSNSSRIYFSDATSGGGEYTGNIVYDHSSNHMRFATAETERMRIDSSGRLLVGKAASGAANTGGEFRPGINDHAAVVTNGSTSAGGAAPLAINRRDSFGPLIQMYQMNTQFGEIGTDYANETYIAASGTNSAGILLTSANSVRPMKNGSASDSTQDLGSSNGKWKDLYLSGGIQFDARSNKLSDYEEGTWVPAVTTASSTTAYSAYYTKIGKTVLIQAYIAWTNNQNNNGSQFRINGLPFVVGGNSNSYHSMPACYWGHANMNDLPTFITHGNSQYLYLQENDGNNASVTNTNITGRSFITCIFSGSYQTN